MRKIVFVDMDGVVARYERWAYRGRILDDVREKEPIFTQKGSKFFRTCKPDLNAISMVKGLNSINSLSVMVLSGVSSGEVGEEQIEDKSYWLKKNMYFLNETQQLFTSGSKVTEACSFLGIRELNKDLILIDDFNGNLLEWQIVFVEAPVATQWDKASTIDIHAKRILGIDIGHFANTGFIINGRKVKIVLKTL